MTSRITLDAVCTSLSVENTVADRASKPQKMSSHRDPGTHNVLGSLRDYSGISMKDAMGISVRIL
jgi:hypothetical protein